MKQPDEQVLVVVKDIQMGFGSMVVFMVKWAIASIPAIIILSALASLVAMVCYGGEFWD